MQTDVFEHMERYHCFDAHSCLSHPDASEILKNLNSAITTTHDDLQSATHMIITLGTAWVYRYIESDMYVANCHKLPQKQFLKELLPVDHILESLEGIYQLIKSVNPTCQMILTVSPVRHLKDGFIENSRSKSHLISAVQQLVENASDCHYFPSYEIMMDELRDYRFYAEDMLHPNTTAINYIWEKFQTTWIEQSAYPTMETVEKIQNGLNHRPFHPNSESHHKFLAQLQRQKADVINRFSHIRF